MEVEQITQALTVALPGVFTRTAVTKLMPGIISAGHLANLNAKGCGPDFVRVGKRVIYEKDSFIRWFGGYLAKRTVPEQVQNQEVETN